MISHVILEIIKEAGQVATKVCFVSYTTSYQNLIRYRKGSDWLPPEEFKKAQEKLSRELKKKEYQRFVNTLAYLKRKGFIEKQMNNTWTITDHGHAWLQRRNERRTYSAPLRSSVQEDDQLKVIIFDIPEQQSNLRHWLRCSLQNLEFSLLQKSVWIGKRKLPEEFFHQLREFDLIPYVHIFAVQETGSIELDSVMKKDEY